MIVVTGPTGSGKTTTLAGALGYLNDPSRKIVTIEDPVEYQIAGVNQIQIHPEIGLTFARTLRSLLRFDPDIMMIGEMRDSETASIGVNAALTGHLVLTTLHTNSAAGAIVRLLDLGVQAYLIASTLRCVVGQRLVRKLCPHCRDPYEASPDLIAQLPAAAIAGFASPIRLWRATGCAYCGGSGYSGRAAIFELLTVDDDLRRLIKPDVSAEEIAQSARRSGMTTMMADGLRKCCEGLTTIEEKALGNIQKIGKKCIVDGVLDKADAPTGPGLWFMDSSSAAAEMVTLCAAAGYVVHFFPTGQGNVIGNPIMPVIKVTGNPRTVRLMSEHIDVDVSGVVRREITIDQAGDALIDMITRTANGRYTAAEALGHQEFVMTKL